ncbi:MAG TPA: trypsin-like peptidase domain-containing protein [Xanthobacteraceae bacterium]|nr:trypsin-like peptidase domain-containing protein [Xanthobacteraceae bacterium]
MSRLARLGLGVAIVLLAVIAAQPYLRPLLFSATAPRPVDARGSLSEFERATIAIFETVAPSVVQVVARPTVNPFSDGEQAASGTGFVWDRAGHVVTNNHVVQSADLLAVRLASGEVVHADPIGTAPNYDLAVLRLRTARRLPPPVTIGSSSDLKVGQAAFVIGNPFGLDQSLTSGIISALKRRLPTSGGREISNVIQTDAAINPGNSGGPLLDSAGRVIGVTTAIISPSGSNAGIGFAIPIDIVNRVVPQLIRDGRVPTPGIGIVAADEAAATRLGVEGVVVVRVVPESPAARAGLQGVDLSTGAVGDIIVAANDVPVRRLADLTQQIERAGVGSAIKLSVVRGGSERTIEVRIVDIGRS